MVRETGCAAKPFALLFDPGDTLRAPVALLDVDMGGGALMGGIVAAAGVVAAHGRFGAGGRVVSGHVPIGFVAAVAAADRIGLPGVAYACAIGWSFMLLVEIPYYFWFMRKQG